MPELGAVVAVDVGGTTIKGAVVDRAGHFITDHCRPTGAQRGPEAVIEEIKAVIAELREPHPEVSGVGVVIPGIVDSAAGIAKFAANVGFRETPLRQILSDAVGLPVIIDHDVRSAGVAERTVGVTAAVEDSFLAVIGTGIACVTQAAGREVRGATHAAGEFGHIPVWPDGELCACGQRGCLERYASAASIARRYRELTGREVSAAEIATLRDQSEIAARVWREAARSLAIALATCTLLLDPQIIVLAGGLSEAGEALRAPVAAELEALLTLRPAPPVVLSRLGGRAGLVGAAVLTWQSLGVSDFSVWD